MADNQAWIVVELADDGDPEAVVETVEAATSDRVHGQRESDSRVVVYDGGVTTTDTESALASVDGQLDRVVIVESLEGREGATRSRYYEVDGPTSGDEDLGNPVDDLSSVSRWFVESHFDYYATRYGIDGGI